MLAALCIGFIAVNGSKAHAEEATEINGREADSEEIVLNEYEGKNFIYSAEFTPVSSEAEAAGLVFGAKENLSSYLTATADIKNGKVKLSRSEAGELKCVDYSFVGGQKLKITVVTNDDVVKIFIDDSDVAVNVCKIDDYNGGKLGLLVKSDFTVSKVSFTDTDSPEGDIYCNGYDVLKVVNVTDGNYKLKSSEYTVDGGNLTVSREYLRTLESDTEYVFRVVTSFTDLNFKITTDFTAVTATPAVEKYYRNNDVTLELSGNVTVNKLLIDGKECAFTQTEKSVLISSEEIESLSTGKHSVKLYTDKGRPETTVTISEIVETVSDPVVKATHVFLWIDLAIFLGAIIGYTAFSIISKRKKK